jgi:hypothetical protein
MMDCDWDRLAQQRVKPTMTSQMKDCFSVSSGTRELSQSVGKGSAEETARIDLSSANSFLEGY